VHGETNPEMEIEIEIAEPKGTGAPIVRSHSIYLNTRGGYFASATISR